MAPTQKNGGVKKNGGMQDMTKFIVLDIIIGLLFCVNMFHTYLQCKLIKEQIYELEKKINMDKKGR